MSSPDRFAGMGRGWLRHAVMSSALVMIVAFMGGCRSASLPLPAGPLQPPIEEGVTLLSRPLPGPMAALYRMRVPSSGGFRFSVAAVEGGRGRMTVSEPFGAAVMLAGWEPAGDAAIFDLREGCRLCTGCVSSELGLGGLPLRRAHRLLGGRLPAITGDPVQPVDDRVVQVALAEGSVRATLARDPWRVVEVVGSDFRVWLEDHTSSLPGRLIIESSTGERAVIELVRLQWEYDGEWAQLPDVPVCEAR